MFRYNLSSICDRSIISTQYGIHRIKRTQSVGRVRRHHSGAWPQVGHRTTQSYQWQAAGSVIVMLAHGREMTRSIITHRYQVVSRNWNLKLLSLMRCYRLNYTRRTNVYSTKGAIAVAADQVDWPAESTCAVVHYQW